MTEEANVKTKQPNPITPPVPVNQSPQSIPPGTQRWIIEGPPPPNSKWIEAFYKECGREVTLAYTTLNQMKNWAILVCGALLSSLAFSVRTGNSEAKDFPNQMTFFGTVLVYLFVLRFFVRAILCYNNLLRWNCLQAACIEAFLIPRDAPPESTAGGETKLHATIQTLYYSWASPIERKSQLLSNLKLGFGLLFALSMFFLIWSAFALWSEPFIRALTLFTVGATAIEAVDFLQSPYFDDENARKRRAERRRSNTQEALDIFPIPRLRTNYATAWIGLVLATFIVAHWSQITAGFAELVKTIYGWLVFFVY
jgi:hypothetical protein